MTAFAIQTAIQYYVISCYKCGIRFAVENELDSNWRRDKTQFFCPMGHPQSYTESEADRLKRELAKVTQDRDWQKQRAETASKRAEKAEKAQTRLKKRVNAGVCPHCQRTVGQMARHIKTCHPECLKET